MWWFHSPKKQSSRWNLGNFICACHISLQAPFLWHLIFLTFPLLVSYTASSNKTNRNGFFDCNLVLVLRGAKQSKPNSIPISLLICTVCLDCDLSSIEMPCLFLLNQKYICKNLRPQGQQIFFWHTTGNPVCKSTILIIYMSGISLVL